MGCNCEECIANTYRDPALHPTDNDTCKLCDCYLPGTTNNEMDCVMNEKVAISPAVPGIASVKWVWEDPSVTSAYLTTTTPALVQTACLALNVCVAL